MSSIIVAITFYLLFITVVPSYAGGYYFQFLLFIFIFKRKDLSSTSKVYEKDGVNFTIHHFSSYSDAITSPITVRYIKNKLLLERLICPPSEPTSIVESIYCNLKRISRFNIKIDIRANFSQQLNDIWIHSVFYHKFNGITFQKFPIDLWENMCDWLSGKGKSYVMDWSFGKILQYSNLNHTCPLSSLIVKVDNTSMDTFSFEQSFIPSGNYRVDIDFSESRVIAFICGVIVIILMALALASTDWLMAAGFREGLFLHCIENDAIPPLPFGLGGQAGCYASRDLFYIQATAALCIISLITDAIATLLTGLGLRTKNHNVKYRFYRYAVLVMLLALISVLVALILYPVCFAAELNLEIYYKERKIVHDTPMRA